MDNKLVQQAVDIFGLTRDYNEAGYILADGRMLDFSGRYQMVHEYRRRGDYWVPRLSKEVDWQAGTRNVDHRDLGELDIKNTGWLAAVEFMRRTGAVRLAIPIGVTIVDMISTPQAGIIAYIFSKIEQSFEQLYIIERVDRSSGDDIDHVELDPYSSLSKILREVVKMFPPGHVPVWG